MGKRSKRKTTQDAPAQAPAANEAASNRAFPDWVGVLAIIAIAFWVYLPALNGKWLWDDDWYVTNQPLLRDFGGLLKIWFAPGSFVEYYPVEQTLLWIEWQLFGDATTGYHVVTLALHIINALLVWRLLARLGLSKAWLGGMIFAAHPALVDSVAWVAETKNTASTLPFLLAVIAWIDYENGRRSRDYKLSLLYFTIAMLCKIVVAPLPFVFVLYAWWKRRRIARADLAAAAPFLGIAVVLSALSVACGTWYYQHHDKFGTENSLGTIPDRIALAGQSLARYAAHTVWPVNLLPIYPQWKIDPAAPLVYLPWLVLAAVVAFGLFRPAQGRHALLGAGFFFLFLAPFLGFVGASYMNFSWIMDHFLYVPIIGVIGLFVAALQRIEDSLYIAAKPAVTGFATIVVVLLAFEAHAYAGVYADETNLWSYTLAYYPNSYVAHYNLANEFVIAGNIPEAIPHYEKAIELKPDYITAHNNLGMAYAKSGRLVDAKAQFEAALQIMPNYAGAQHNLDQVNMLLNAPSPQQ